MQQYLQETEYFDFNHPLIQSLAKSISGDSLKEKAIEVYYRVRDDIRYNPYVVKEGFKSLVASHALELNQSYCIPKSGLMIASCRFFGIPARLGLADVRNHLSSPKLLEMLGTDYFAMHGYAEVYLNDRWLKVTPVFNSELCERFGVEPLDCDGESDAVFQAYTSEGHRHMEYLKDHGQFADMPVKLIFDSFKEHYPMLVEHMGAFDERESLESDLQNE